MLRDAGAVILGKANLSEFAGFRHSNANTGWSARGGRATGIFWAQSHQNNREQDLMQSHVVVQNSRASASVSSATLVNQPKLDAFQDALILLKSAGVILIDDVLYN